MTSLIADDQIRKLRQDFPTIQGNGNTYSLDVVFHGTAHKLSIILPQSFPNGSIIVEFIKPVVSPMVNSNGRFVVSEELRNFNGSYWLSDTLKSVINKLNQAGVHSRDTAPYASPSIYGSRSPYSPSYITRSPASTFPPNRTLSVEESWANDYSQLYIERKQEKELDLIISNAEYRRQLLETTRGIDHLRSLIGSIANMIKTYKGISQQYMDKAKEHDDLLVQVHELEQKVETKKSEICQNYKMYEMEELKRDVKNRIQVLNTQITELKEQLENQTIDYPTFIKNYSELSIEMNMLSECLNLCA